MRYIAAAAWGRVHDEGAVRGVHSQHEGRRWNMGTGHDSLLITWAVPHAEAQVIAVEAWSQTEGRC